MSWSTLLVTTLLVQDLDINFYHKRSLDGKGTNLV